MAAKNQATGVIESGLGTFSKDKFRALVNVRANALKSVRDALTERGYTEVSVASLVNIAGSCENPNASFTLPYYGREAHLSQSAQLQLEALVIRLLRGFFTVNNSFREENYDDPDAAGRRLSEFTLIEPEMPYPGLKPDDALSKIIEQEEEVVKKVVEQTLASNEQDIGVLGGDVGYLKKAHKAKFNRISYDDAIALLNKLGGRTYSFGDDLNIAEERKILAFFDNVPTFVTHYPAKIKFFNMKRTPDGERVYSVDLLLPKLGESTGGAVREEDGEKIKSYLLSSKVGQFLRDKGQDPLLPFTEYFKLFEQEPPVVRGGFGIGFERLIGFLLQSNDILDTISYRTMQP
ncbi:MAG: asparagine-tRNA ligase [Candidatus Peregrinibacteria bacterium Greene0416_19]|nr:MAG: asparagine-tRNA ligase [Candidatus Peregrinibacteria bacterium Greene0416_19]